MQELWDAEGVRELLYEICAGTVKVLDIFTENTLTNVSAAAMGTGSGGDV